MNAKARGLVAAAVALTVAIGFAALTLLGGDEATPAARPGGVAQYTTQPATGSPDGERIEASASSARLEGGARDAAIAYATAPQHWLYLDDEALEEAVREVASARSAERLVAEIQGEVGLARDGLARSAGPVWWLVRPLAWNLQHYTPERAEVSVWTVSVLSAADVAVPQADWVRVNVEVVWEDERWRVDDASDVPGPTPAVGGRDEPWQPEALDEALAGFERIEVEVSQ